MKEETNIIFRISNSLKKEFESYCKINCMNKSAWLRYQIEKLISLNKKK